MHIERHAVVAPAGDAAHREELLVRRGVSEQVRLVEGHHPGEEIADVFGAKLVLSIDELDQISRSLEVAHGLARTGKRGGRVRRAGDGEIGTRDLCRAALAFAEGGQEGLAGIGDIADADLDRSARLTVRHRPGRQRGDSRVARRESRHPSE